VTYENLRFTDETKLEAGLRVIMDHGLVQYTDKLDVYRIPHAVVALLDQHGIPYEVVKSQPNSSPRSPS
jgi:hypothetical protein